MTEWIEHHQSLAYGILELKPWEFERLQPHEFMSLLDGYKQRKEERENIFAYFVAQIMNASGNFKETVTAERLLKPLRPEMLTERAKQRIADEEYLREQFKHLLPEGV